MRPVHLLAAAAVCLGAAPAAAQIPNLTAPQLPAARRDLTPIVPQQPPQAPVLTPVAVIPRYAVTAAPTAFVPGQVVDVTLTASGVSGTLALKEPVTGSGCRFTPLPGRPLPTAAAAAGQARVTVKGFFGPDNATGACVVAFRLTGADSLGAPFEAASAGGSLTPAPFQTYTVSNTSQLKDRLNFGLREGQGTCSGNSTGPSGTFPVGVLTQNDDITFSIRSGPLGTECNWRSKVLLLPNGMRFERAALLPKNDDRCAIRNANPAAWGGVNSLNPVQAPNVVVGDNPNGAGAPAGYYGPIDVTLQCGTTAINDRNIQLQIDALVFRGPPGLSFP